MDKVITKFGRVDGHDVQILITNDDFAEPHDIVDNHLGRIITWCKSSTIGDSHKFKDIKEFLLDALASHRCIKNKYYDIENAEKVYQKYVEEEKERTRETGQRLNFRMIDQNFIAVIEKQFGDIFMPIYAYIHSGIVISTGPFSCPWDSGQIGWYHVTKANIRDFYAVKKITAELAKKAHEEMVSTIKIYSEDYLNGTAYNVELLIDGESTESCGGYWGYSDPEVLAKEFAHDHGYDISAEGAVIKKVKEAV